MGQLLIFLRRYLILDSMQAANTIFFNPLPTQTYKIVSVLDGRKAFTIQQGSKNLIIQDYTGSPSQTFNIYINNKTYAFVSQLKALRIQNENSNDGGVVQASQGQFPSSYFQIVPVTKGEWANKACFIKTFAGRALDIKGALAVQNAEVCQWNFHGGNNQIWVITPNDQPTIPSIIPPIGGNQVQQQTNAEVPIEFVANPGTLYKVVSVLNQTKAFTIDKTTNKLSIKTYTGQTNQKFNIFTQQSKFAFVAAYNQWGLCIYKDSKQNMGQPVVDGGRHPSSWFEVSRAKQGQWANKAYLIKTHAGTRGLDISGGACEDGKQIVQYDIHGGNNQLWLILPADQQTGTNSQYNNPQVPKPIDLPNPQPQVAASFVPIQNTQYRIVSVLNKTKSLTIDQTTFKASIKTYTGDATQKFTVYVEGNKFAFVNSSKNAGLCVFQDNKNNSADVVVDLGKHPSSWFEVVRNIQGKWANRAYIIKTHAATKALDIEGGLANQGQKVLQYESNGGQNQLWLILPAEQPLPQNNQPQNNQPSNSPWSNNLFSAIQNFGSQGSQPQQPNINIPFTFQPTHFIQPNINLALFPPNKNYIFYAAHSNGLKAIDVSQGFTDYGNLILYSFHGAPNQRFTFEQEGNLYRIKSVANGKYVKVTNDDSNDGMWIKTDDKGSKSELWSITPSTDSQFAGKGAYNVRSVFGKALQVPGGQLGDSTKIQQGSFTGGVGQNWIIKEI